MELESFGYVRALVVDGDDQQVMLSFAFVGFICLFSASFFLPGFTLFRRLQLPNNNFRERAEW